MDRSAGVLLTAWTTLTAPSTDPVGASFGTVGRDVLHVIGEEHMGLLACLALPGKAARDRDLRAGGPAA